MAIEYEAKFLAVDESALQQKLNHAGAQELHSRFLLRRQTFDFPVQSSHKKWARVRDEGAQVTMTIKHLRDATSIDGMHEVELVVHDFHTACEFLASLGLTAASYQENYRQAWRLGGAVITLDTWPGIPPFVEIEGPSQEVVEDCIKALGFEVSQAYFGSIDGLYEQALGIAPLVFNQIPRLTFENAPTVLASFVEAGKGPFEL